MPFDRETGEWIDEDEEGGSTAVAEEDRPEVDEPEREEAPRDIGEYQRRAQEFLYGHGDFPSPYPESEGGSTATPSPYQTPERSVYQPGPRMQEYKTAIEQMPLRQDFHPSGLRRALGIVAGIGTGIATSNPAEAAASRDISTYAPYSRRAANYQQELQKKGQLAQLEAGGNQAARQYYLDLAKIQQEQETARGRTAYQRAQEAHGELYRAQSDPAWWAARANAMSRTGAIGAPYTVKDSTGKTRMVTMAPGGGIKDASGTLIPPDQYDASTLKRVGTAGIEHVPTNPFELWHQQNPDKPAEEWLKLHPTSESEYADYKVGYLQQHPGSNSTEIVKAFAASKEQPQRPPQALLMPPGGGAAQLVRPGTVVPPGMVTASGESQLNTPTAATRGRAQQASVVIDAGNDLKQFILQNQGKLGNVESYWKSFVNGTPISDPVISEFQTRLASFAALQAAAHGFRGSNVMKDFESRIGGPAKNTDSMISAINGIESTMKELQKSGGSSFGAAGPVGAGGVGAATHVYDPKTGTIRPK